MKSLRKILALLDDDARKKIPIVVLAGLMASMLEMVGLGILPFFVKLLADPDVVFIQLPSVKIIMGHIGLDNGRGLIYMACFGLVIFYVLKTLFMIGVFHIQAEFMRKVMVGIGKKMFDAYLFAPYKFHLHANSGEVIRNVTHAPQYFGASLVFSVVNVFLYGVIIVGIMLLVTIMYPQIALILFIPALIAWGFMAIIRKSTIRHGRVLQEAVASMTSLTNHALGSIKETHVRGCHEYLRNRYQEQMNKLGKAFQYQRFAPNIVKPVMELFGILIFIILILTYLVADRSLADALPVIVLFLAAVARLTQNVFPLTQSLTSIRTYRHLIDLLGNDIAEVGESQQIGNAGDIESDGVGHTEKDKNTTLEGDIEIRNLGYRYPNTNEWAIRDVSINIAQHTAVALVGASGSGKTTLVDLMLGLILAEEGQILIGGKSIGTNLKVWQQDIGYIPQTIYLLDESIRRNVAFGLPEHRIDDRRVWEVLRIAQLEEYVKNIPGQLDSNVGERGIRISGGQKQRIGIARALYHKPGILIMDEATSALDSATESAIMQEISGFRNTCTVIMVAHRLSTVKDCDELFLLEKGSVIARGTFDELMAKSRDFRNLANAL